MDPKPILTLQAEAVHGTGRWPWNGAVGMGYAPGAKLPAGMPAADSGKYVVHWMQQNGKWLMVDERLEQRQPAAHGSPTATRPGAKGR